ncbi:DUF6053 domain-containing protein [Lysobacter enzymogenes]|uniref:DUF6053 domain-containing protein n=1 Tax=Lysobacter enzymogenes TaxID=69 RepID=UPI003D2F8758
MASGNRLLRRTVPGPAVFRRAALVGGASAPTLSSRIAATGHKSVGAEAPPTRDPQLNSSWLA